MVDASVLETDTCSVGVQVSPSPPKKVFQDSKINSQEEIR